MTDFVPAAVAVKHKCQENGPSDVAFVETGDHKYPTYYACGKKHRGGYMSCLNVTKEVRERIIKAVDVEHFDRHRKQDNNITLSTKGTARTRRKSTPRKGNPSPRLKRRRRRRREPSPLYLLGVSL